MSIDIRAPRDDEMREFLNTLEAAFGYLPTEELIERLPKVLEPSRLLVATEGAGIVGVGGAFRFNFTIPGNDIPVAGVTMVGVLPSHRRRGVLTRMMRRQLEDARSWNEPIAVLWASEGSIYQRFGYGLASRQLTLDIERDRAVFLEHAEPTGTARMVGNDQALEILPGIYDRVRAQRTGMPSRSKQWWVNHRLADPEDERNGGGPMWRVVVEINGRPEAYALYRLHGSWEESLPSGHVSIIEVVAATPEATREVWRYVFGIDLSARVKAYWEPIDTPLQHLLSEVRRLRLGLKDALWLRIVDVRGALEARSYEVDDTLTFRLVDHFCDWNAGVWRIEVDGGKPRVAESDAAPDLALSARDLGATYLGGTSFTELALAGRVQELRPDALRRADALFHNAPAPWCPEVF